MRISKIDYQGDRPYVQRALSERKPENVGLAVCRIAVKPLSRNSFSSREGSPDKSPITALQPHARSLPPTAIVASFDFTGVQSSKLRSAQGRRIRDTCLVLSELFGRSKFVVQSKDREALHSRWATARLQTQLMAI